MLNGVINEIIEYKKSEIQKKKNRLPVSELLGIIKEVRSARDFAAAVSAPGHLNIIAEIKKASLSAGVIRFDFDPIALSGELEAAGAGAISVLTEEKYFLGDLFHLISVSENVKIPVLRKDFIIDEYQVYESRAYNADALLLIARLHEKNQLQDLISLCRETGIAALVEIHDEKDAEKALEVNASIIGINNRDLDNLTVDLSTSLRLIGRLPKDKIIVAESGVKTREDALKMKNAGFNAVLVGEVLMGSRDLKEKLKELSV